MLRAQGQSIVMSRQISLALCVSAGGSLIGKSWKSHYMIKSAILNEGKRKMLLTFVWEAVIK